MQRQLYYPNVPYPFFPPEPRAIVPYSSSDCPSAPAREADFYSQSHFGEGPLWRAGDRFSTQGASDLGNAVAISYDHLALSCADSITGSAGGLGELETGHNLPGHSASDYASSTALNKRSNVSGSNNPCRKNMPEASFINAIVTTGENPKHHGTARTRQRWPHTFENLIFDANERSTIPLSHRRPIYIASLEAHIESLHSQLHSLGFWPVPVEHLQEHEGLHFKSAKSVLAGLFHDIESLRSDLVGLEREAECPVAQGYHRDIAKPVLNN